MPIELRTGLPGAGKTLGAVEHMLHLRKHAPERPVYCLGVTDLRDGIAVPLDEAGLKNWQQLPAGSIIVVDECQKWMPAKRGAENSPQWIRDLSTHRHLGLDFIFITQHPSLIDTYVRKLVDRHIHTVRKYGTQLVERWSWPICMQDPNSITAKKQAESKSRNTYSQEAMQSYKSAELHTVKRTIPRFLIIGLVVLLGLPVLGYLAYWAMHRAGEKGAVVGSTSAQEKTSDAGALIGRTVVDTLRQEDYAKWARPRVDGVPWSAPMFDRLEVKATPQLFCVAVDDGKCVCHTEQGTRYEMKPARCREIAANGMYNPFVDASSSVKVDSRRGDVPVDARKDVGSPSDGSVPAGEGEGMVRRKDRQTATSYTPPEYHEWNADPFGGVSKGGR
ncbi:zonular occludens toxin domain-containing protein [Dyella sp.]|uniref:zonular occludens toxin domain-containing protein n=1 Tax=Dyella sp. TaxID=1869338 RepID=UPI0028416C43|nr:zonular occludens toxin domain-containing protein [Dyella sp.]MDR3443705.1 zonular occludens toxin domain-containing protein [Dyella sp.]